MERSDLEPTHMEPRDALSKKTTILLTPELHARLTALAADTGTSLGDLDRRACEKEYGVPGRADRLEAVRELSELRLPVGDPRALEAESVPRPEDLLP